MLHRTVIVWIIYLFVLAGCDQKPQDVSNESMAIKIATIQSGMYRVNASDLAKFGVRIQVVKDGIFSLRLRGDAIPYWIKRTGTNTSLVFYATASDSNYTHENIYILAKPDQLFTAASSITGAQTGLEPEPEALLAESAGTYIASILHEQNLFYLPQVINGDNWLWRKLPAKQHIEFDFDVNELARDSTAILQLAVWSNTDAPLKPDHHLFLHINGELVQDHSWDGAGLQIITAQIPAGYINDGSNILTVQAPGDLGLTAEMYYVDWFRVNYHRKPVAQNDQLEFIQDESHIQLNGFSGPVDVYDITIPSQPTLYSEQLPKDGEFSGASGSHYLAVGPNGYLAPQRLESMSESPLLPQGQQGADYVIIGPRDLLEPMQPLLDLRQAQGMVTVAIPLDRIFDQFNGGFPEPAAITTFLRFAMGSWQPLPRFVLLVGDGSYDPRGNISSNDANRLPVFLVNTHFGGQTVSDVDYVQLNQDVWPDIAIGHVPARTAAQVQVWVQKTLTYERSMDESGNSMSILAIADGQEMSFKQDAQAFLDLFPPTYTKSLYAPDPGVTDAPQIIRNYWRQNFNVVAYFGHGSINMWGKDRLFSGEDVGELPSDANAPIIVNMTCLTGYFIHPQVESLAETLLWQPGSGAVAVLAPSSLTLPTDQSVLSNVFVRLLVDSSHATLGEIHLEARRSMPVDVTGALEVMQTFMLFGDPALRLSHP